MNMNKMYALACAVAAFGVGLSSAAPISSALIAPPAARQLQDSDECTGGYVDCVKGFVASNPSQTCEDACAGQCCVGSSACNFFTGKVCRDNVSCGGDSACSGANIEHVNGGCFGFWSCSSAVIDYVGGMSCNGTFACEAVGKNGGRIGRIENKSCHGKYSCSYAAKEAANIGSITNSCHGKYSCSYMAEYGGYIGSIVDSCDGKSSCWATAACSQSNPNCGSNVTSIISSCSSDEACSFMAPDGGKISCVSESCNAERACTFSFQGSGNNLDTGLKSCCNSFEACRRITEATVPAECSTGTRGTSNPTQSLTTGDPTRAPTSDPSSNPTMPDVTAPPTTTPTSDLTSRTKIPIATPAPVAAPRPDSSSARVTFGSAVVLCTMASLLLLV